MSMPECSVVVDAAVSVAGATAVSVLLLPQAARPAMRTAANEVAAAVRVGSRIRKVLRWEARFSRRTGRGHAEERPQSPDEATSWCAYRATPVATVASS